MSATLTDWVKFTKQETSDLSTFLIMMISVVIFFIMFFLVDFTYVEYEILSHLIFTVMCVFCIIGIFYTTILMYFALFVKKQKITKEDIK